MSNRRIRGEDLWRLAKGKRTWRSEFEVEASWVHFCLLLLRQRVRGLKCPMTSGETPQA